MIPYFWVYDTPRLTGGCISGEIIDLRVDIHAFLGYTTSYISETITTISKTLSIVKVMLANPVVKKIYIPKY